MAGPVEKRELIIPIRTILIVSAAIGVLGAFVAIGDTFLIVFIGIFLGLVFEFPVRFVIRKTGWSRGLAATVTVLGTAIGVVLIGLLFLVPTVAGTTQGVTAWLLGSSFALGLGVIAGLLDMIPNLGATLAGFILVPAIWAESGIGAAIVMLIVVLVYQQVENNILTPKIQGRAVNLSGFFIIVAVTLFGALLGVLGALTAVPLAATVQIFVQELTKARREKVAAARASAE